VDASDKRSEGISAAMEIRMYLMKHLVKTTKGVELREWESRLDLARDLQVDETLDAKTQQAVSAFEAILYHIFHEIEKERKTYRSMSFRERYGDIKTAVEGTRLFHSHVFRDSRQCNRIL
jgi:hypothetical protein